MIPQELVEHLRTQGVKLWVEGDLLRYSAPKGVLTSELRERMIAHKEALIRLVGLEVPSDAAGSMKLEPIPRDGELPLSPFQRRVWFLEELEPGNPAYNINITFRLKGTIDIPALVNSVNHVISRHEVLRSTCNSENGRPRLTVHAQLPCEVNFVDLNNFSAEGREAEALRLTQEEARRPFRFETGPLVRLVLLKLNENEHWLLLTTHHFASDGLSTRLLFDEIAATYSTLIQGDNPSSKPDPLQYVDFADWQHKQMESDTSRRQLEYWKQMLAGAPAVLEFPSDRPRPAVKTSQGAMERFTLPVELMNGLTALSRHEGVTLFMTLLSAFQALLHRYSRQSDIVVGTAVSNRNRSELETILGPFTNTLLMRCDLSGNPTFRELLLRVRDTALGAYSNQDLPFVKLVETLSPKRDPSMNPLFQTMLVLHQSSVAENFDLAGVEVERLYIDLGTSRLDIGLEMTASDQGLEGALEYNTDIYDSASMRQFISSFQQLLAAVAGNSELRLSELPLLSGAERRELIATSSRGPKPNRGDLPLVVERFQAQAAKSSAAIAIVSDLRNMTYAELNELSNQLARKLRGLGVRPESRVALCLRRSPDMVVALMAIWKAGGVYVPVDPDYPAARIEFMLNDTAAEVLITQSSLVDALPDHKSSVVCIDDDWSEIACESSANLELANTGEDAAYVIFTSGSTGVPKGVVVCHREIADYIHDAVELLRLTSSDCILQFFSINFDPSLEQILTPLLAGARMALRGDDVWLPDEFGRRFRDFGVTVAAFTPVVWLPVIRHWHENPDDGPGSQFRTMIIGGDFLPPEGLRLWRESELRDVRFLNAYGPTETTISATYCDVRENLERALTTGRLPIGRPLPGRTAYILDEHGNPLPPGVPGELYLGGEGIARGYSNRPDITAERFLPDHISSTQGARMYRTGDLAKWLPDGQIEMLGRIDHQVKIRGFRVELGEIEAAIARQPGVDEAVVVVKGDQADEKRLAAYLVFKPGQSRTISEVRAALSQVLTDYMLPATFTELDRLPVSPNGKLDRSALPEPDWTRPDWSEPYEAPRTPVEEILSEIWAEVLRIDRVGIRDNFFELGGHSLLATQVISRLRETFEIELPLRTLFERPTVDQLALAILQILASGVSEYTLDEALMELE